MSEKTPDELEGIVYVGEDGEVEGAESNVELPALTTAADLLPPEPDPLDAIPVEPPDDDTPPEEAAPSFIVLKNAYGPGAHSFKLADGRPVGVWLSEEHPDLDGGQVAEMLILMGLDGEAAAWFGLMRDKKIAANRELMQHPDVQMEMAQDMVRSAQKKAIQDAFVKAQARK